MKLVFFDTEYTGGHAFTTLVSVGLVRLDGRELYLTLSDYARGQVTNWLRENVLSLIDEQLKKKQDFLNVRRRAS